MIYKGQSCLYNIWISFHIWIFIHIIWLIQVSYFQDSRILGKDFFSANLWLRLNDIKRWWVKVLGHICQIAIIFLVLQHKWNNVIKILVFSRRVTYFRPFGCKSLGTKVTGPNFWPGTSSWHSLNDRDPRTAGPELVSLFLGPWPTLPGSRPVLVRWSLLNDIQNLIEICFTTDVLLWLKIFPFYTFCRMYLIMNLLLVTFTNCDAADCKIWC